jgi:hypothetical protein
MLRPIVKGLKGALFQLSAISAVFARVLATVPVTGALVGIKVIDKNRYDSTGF